MGNDYPWYPVTGNHETETVLDMTWLRNYNSGGNTLPNVVKIGLIGGEETTYSFDYGNTHFIVLNEYYDNIMTDNSMYCSTYRLNLSTGKYENTEIFQL